MTTSTPAQIFISYATKDGAGFAANLRRDLQNRGHNIWQDITALEGGRDWWTQIEERLKSKELQHVVLALTPAALSRPIIRDEIHLARQEGKTLIPVRGPGFDGSATLPRHIGQVMDLEKPEHKATFLRMLDGPSLQKPVPMMARMPPLDYVARPVEFNALKGLLLDPGSNEAVAITAALRGTTGYGKTTLARALAYDNDIRDAYFDGTLFVELGQKGVGRIVALISDIIGLIDKDRKARDFHTPDGAGTALAQIVQAHPKKLG
jgi:TIR domain